MLGDRSLFPDLAPHAYLNHAGISPPSLPVQRAVAAMAEAYARQGGAAVGDAVRLRSRLRELLAQLLGAAARDIALTSGTSAGLQIIALSYPWRAGDRLLLFDGEFPANVSPWLRAAERFGLEPRFLKLTPFAEGDGSDGLAQVEAELRRGVRLVAVSAVQYRSGLAMPLAALASLCHAHGAALCVDAVQACGVVPIDAPALGIDFLAGGAHKWLMGLEGTGFLWIRPGRLEELHPVTTGWLSHEEAASFLLDGPGLLRYDRPLRTRADRFEAGSSSALSQAALHASLELILELGVAAIRAHVDAYLDRLEPILVERGYQSLRAPDARRRSGILSVLPPAGRGAKEIRERLAARGVAIATPDGALRFAPHWPNALGEVEQVAEALDGR
ncbi:MAG TPA: aminotransferase class V-fold PLP-dependent enzyme [Anaeromyxobacteraceae bacterium]|nr:aminotransferase class V-fold PLP-dependent enzyme [Anaeromyxobacteraceae bacterium]